MAQQTIAELNIEIGADLKQLARARAELYSYAKAAGSMVTSFANLSDGARSGIAKQDAAIRSAKREFQSLMAEMTKNKAPVAAINELTAAHSKYVKTLKSGLLDTLNASQNTDRWKDATVKATREVNIAKNANQQAAVAVKNHTDALFRQEMALARGGEVFKSMSAAIASGGGKNAAAMMAQLTAANARFTGRVGVSGGNTQEIKRSMNELSAATNQLKRDLGSLGSGTAVRGFQALQANLGGLTKAVAQLGFGALSGVSSRMAAFGLIAAGITFPMALLTAGLIAVGFAVIRLGKFLFETQLSFDKINNALYAVTGSTAAAASEFEYVSKTSQTLGTDLSVTGKEYVKLVASAQGTSLAGQATKDIFEGLSMATVALGLDTQETGGAFKAIGQIMSKGRVQSEELRGQLGEHLPGAFALAARAMKMTTSELDKLLKAGSLLPREFIPAFAAALKESYQNGAATAANKLQGAINNLNTAMFTLGVRLLEVTGFGDKLVGIFKALTGWANSASEAMTPKGILAATRSTLDARKKELADLQNQVDTGRAMPGGMGQARAKKMAELNKQIEALEATVKAADVKQSIDDIVQGEYDMVVASGAAVAGLRETGEAAKNTFETLSKAAHSDTAALEHYTESMDAFKKALPNMKAAMMEVDNPDGGKMWVRTFPDEKIAKLKKALEDTNPWNIFKKNVSESTDALKREGDAARIALGENKLGVQQKLAMADAENQFAQMVKAHPIATDPSRSKELAGLKAVFMARAAEKFQLEHVATAQAQANLIYKTTIDDLRAEADEYDNVNKYSNRQIFIMKEIQKFKDKNKENAWLMDPRGAADLEKMLKGVEVQAGQTFDTKTLHEYSKAYQQMMEEIKDSSNISLGSQFMDDLAKAEANARTAHRKSVIGFFGEEGLKDPNLIADADRLAAAAKLNVILKEQREVTLALRTPLQTYAAALADINVKLKEGVMNESQAVRARQLATAELIQNDQVLNALSGSFDRFAESAVDSFVEAGAGAMDFRKLLMELVKDLYKTFLMMTIMAPIKAALFGSTGQGITGYTAGFGGGLLGMMLGGGGAAASYGMSSVAAGQMTTLGGAPFMQGFASGGRVKIPGAGGADSRIFSAKVSPGEVISFTPPGKEMGGGSGPMVQINVNVEGGSKGEAADMALAKNIGAEVDKVVEAKVISVLRGQSRPGGMLSPSAMRKN